MNRSICDEQSIPRTDEEIAAWAVKMTALSRKDDEAGVVSSEDKALRKALDDERYLAQCGVPRRYRHPSWDRVAVPAGIDMLRSYCEHIRQRMLDGGGLLLQSPPGRGKSSILALIALAARDVMLPHEGIPRAPVVRYVFAPDLYHALTFPDRYQAERELLSEWRTCDLLLLDDADRLYRGQSGYHTAEFDAFVEHRYAQVRSTVMALNDAGAFGGEEWAAAQSRWSETMEVVMLTGDDQRRRSDI